MSNEKQLRTICGAAFFVAAVCVLLSNIQYLTVWSLVSVVPGVLVGISLLIKQPTLTMVGAGISILTSAISLIRSFIGWNIIEIIRYNFTYLLTSLLGIAFGVILIFIVLGNKGNPMTLGIIAAACEGVCMIINVINSKRFDYQISIWNYLIYLCLVLGAITIGMYYAAKTTTAGHTNLTRNHIAPGNQMNAGQTYQSPNQNYQNQGQGYQNQANQNQTSQYQGGMTTGQWFLTILICCIPVINVIMLLVWAFSGNTNPSKKNWAKAQLIWALIGVGLVMIYILAGGALIGSIF